MALICDTWVMTISAINEYDYDYCRPSKKCADLEPYHWVQEHVAAEKIVQNNAFIWRAMQSSVAKIWQKQSNQQTQVGYLYLQMLVRFCTRMDILIYCRVHSIGIKHQKCG